MIWKSISILGHQTQIVGGYKIPLTCAGAFSIHQPTVFPRFHKTMTRYFAKAQLLNHCRRSTCSCHINVAGKGRDDNCVFSDGWWLQSRISPKTVKLKARNEEHIKLRINRFLWSYEAQQLSFSWHCFGSAASQNDTGGVTNRRAVADAFGVSQVSNVAILMRKCWKKKMLGCLKIKILRVWQRNLFCWLRVPVQFC